MLERNLAGNEIRGDWANLKGTEYHLIYALWVLIKDQVSHVQFYEGNDLVTNLVTPPRIADEEHHQAVTIKSWEQDVDVWIQLKSGEKQWSPSRILNELLSTFLCNALQSKVKGRQWEVRLVTQANVDKTALQNFVSNASRGQRLSQVLQRIVSQVKQKCDLDSNYADHSADDIQVLAIEVLRQLISTRPKALETLKAQIETEITLLHPDRYAVGQIGDALIGRLLQDSAAGPEFARVYDAAWLEQSAGIPISELRIFNADPVAAYLKASYQPRHWDHHHFVRRERLENVLTKFLTSRKSLFVLIGPSGTGKSWAMADAVSRLLDGRVRIMLKGSDLDHHHTLEALVAKQLRRSLSVNWTGEMFLKHLRAASGSESPIIVVEDILPSSDARGFLRDIAALVESAREYGIKLIITCQKHVWEFHDFSAHIPNDVLFQPEDQTSIGLEGVPNTENTDETHHEIHHDNSAVKNEGISSRHKHSFILTDLTVEEMTDAICRRLPTERADLIANQLRAPAFVALRNPFLLNLYLDQLGTADPVEEDGTLTKIDQLLSARIADLMRRSASAVEVGKDEVELALESLVVALWSARPKGLSSLQTLECLRRNLGELSRPMVKEWKRLGLLTIEEPIHFEEPLISDRLFAEFLRQRFLSIESLTSELRPQEDAGVAKALLRGNVVDPVLLSLSLLKADYRWRSPVIDGLAQCSADDYRIIALLSSLARPDSRGIYQLDASDALGQLVPRSTRAWKWVVGMYMADDEYERFRGAHALGAAIEYSPRQVGSAVRLRLSRANTMENFFSEDRKKRKQYLRISLDPLTRISHSAAAKTGERLIKQYAKLTDTGDSEEVYSRFMESVDFIRGRIALFSEGNLIGELIAELQSVDWLKRFRTACALSPIAHEKPTCVIGVLVDAIRTEQDHRVLNRLLTSAYGLIETSPDELINALQENPITLIGKGSVSSNEVLAMLGNLAVRRPEGVLRILPTLLNNHEPNARAFLSETFSYAWLSIAQERSEVRTQLVDLVVPDLRGVTDRFIPFAIRGAIIARLGKMLLDIPGAGKVTARDVRFTRSGYYFLSTDELLRTNAQSLYGHREYNQLEDLLIECIQEENRVQVHPIERHLYQFQYQCANQSLEMLIHFLHLTQEPLALLNALPRDWQVFRALCRLLEAGCTEPSLVDFAQARCEPGRPMSVQAFDDRLRCLSLLSRVETEARAEMELNRKRLQGPSGLLFGADQPAQILASLTDEQPEHTLAMLDETINSADQLATLYFWYWQTRSWQSLLIARVYLRMFSSDPIDIKEGRDLCEQMLVGVNGLPDSPLKEQYLATYGVISRWLRGDRSVPSIMSSSDGPIQQSHSFSLSLLRTAPETISGKTGIEWLFESYWNRKGWTETNALAIDNGTISWGRSTYTIYFFPATRLAYLALGQMYSVNDPSAQFMKDRKETNKVFAQYSYIFDSDFSPDNSLLASALKDISRRAIVAPSDERPWGWKGHLFLIAGKLRKAEEALLHCLSLGSCAGDFRGSTFYNLSCVYARLGREDDCCQALKDAAKIKPLNREWMRNDPDFESVRDREWFKALIKEPARESICSHINQGHG